MGLPSDVRGADHSQQPYRHPVLVLFPLENAIELPYLRSEIVKRLELATAMANSSGQVMDAASSPFQLELLGDIPVTPVTGMFNQFSNTGDLASVLYTNGRPAVVLNMNMVVAKSYALMLLNLVARYEAATGEKLKTMQELQEQFDRYSAEQNV